MFANDAVSVADTDDPSTDYSDYQHRQQAGSSDEKQSCRQKRRFPPETKKICRVCGDKALSVNFNVVTCESCKAFFRRNALKTKEMHCSSSGNCDINVKSRRTCKRCRLLKCFEVGMIKEWIMDDDARLRKRELIERNREKRRQAAVTMVGDGDGVNPYTIPVDYRLASTSLTPTPPAYSITCSPVPSVQTDPFSPSPSLFQHASTSAFRSPSMLPIANSVSPAYYSTVLPTKTAAGSSKVQSTPAAPVEDMVRVPKTLLASLIDQCQNSMLYCPHRVESSQLRPSVIVARASAPSHCICRCCCGAGEKFSHSNGGTADNSLEILEISEDHEERGSDSDSGFEGSPEADCQLALISSGQSDHTFKFSRGIRGTRLFCLVDLLAAFDFPHRPVGRPNDHYTLMPAGPPIDSYSAAECVRRIEAIIRRCVRFGIRVLSSHGLNRNVLANLLKASPTRLLLAHSIIAYSRQSDGWYDSGPNIRPISAQPLEYVRQGMYEDHMRHISRFPASCKDDMSVIVLMFAIILLDPTRVGKRDRAHVKRMKEFYIVLLTQYLENKFGADKAIRLRDHILAHLEITRVAAHQLTCPVIVDVGGRDLEPLMIDFVGL